MNSSSTSPGKECFSPFSCSPILTMPQSTVYCCDWAMNAFQCDTATIHCCFEMLCKGELHSFWSQSHHLIL